MEPGSKVQTDYLIVGQGLAGSLVALKLLERGKSVRVIDDGHKHAASKVAAGLINPITGRRHALTWRFLECWDYLQGDYARWETQLGGRCFFRKPLLRFFKNEEEQALFEKKWQTGTFEGIEVVYPANAEDIPYCKVREPCYRLEQTGFVDQAFLIEKVRAYLASKASLVIDTWKTDEFTREEGIVRWKGISAKAAIFTQGYLGDRNPFFRELPFRHARGEIIELKGPDHGRAPVLNRGKWLLPVGPGRFKAGATYDLKHIGQEVTDEGITEILGAVNKMVEGPFELVEAQSGVRPALHDFRPVMGRHPWYPELVIFNGLGSKGSLQAPLLAKELVDHLEDGTALHPQADVDRFRNFL